MLTVATLVSSGLFLLLATPTSGFSPRCVCVYMRCCVCMRLHVCVCVCVCACMRVFSFRPSPFMSSRSCELVLKADSSSNHGSLQVNAGAFTARPRALGFHYRNACSISGRHGLPLVAPGRIVTRMVGNGEGGVREGEEEGDREVDASWMGGDELQIMVMREKLEMQLMAARIKAKPIFLPFEKGKK